MRSNVVRAVESERGAVLIITALLVPALVLCGALAFGVTALWTGHEDAQRAADLGALAAAANVPTISPELPVTGLELYQELSGPMSSSDWRDRPCDVAQAQLSGGRSAVPNAFRADADAPKCDPKWGWGPPLLTMLAACAADVAELAGCRDAMSAELRRTLPAVDSLELTAASALGGAADPAVALLDADVAAQLRDACAAQTAVVGLTSVTTLCTATVGDLIAAVNSESCGAVGVLDATAQTVLAALQAAKDAGLLDPTTGQGVGFSCAGLPQHGFDLAGIAPALLTPRVRVDLSGLTMRPLLSPMTFDVTTSATARRVFKSALVLPTKGMPGLAADAWTALPADTKAALTEALGPNASAMLASAAGGDAWVLDPNVLSESAPDLARKALDAIDSNETSVSGAVSSSLCTSLPMGVSCPVGDDLVDEQHLLGPFMEDVWDATRPPPHGSAPTVEEVLDHYATTGETLNIVSYLDPVMLGQLLGSPVWSLVKAQLGPLVSPLMFVPALDVVPAAVFRDGDTFRIQRVAATTGLYKARLVK